MRVLHVIPSIDWENGGPTTALLGLATAQVKAGLTVDVLTTFREDRSGQMMRPFNVRGVMVRMIGPVHGKLGWQRGMAEAVEQSVAEADIVHLHAVWESVLHHAARAAQLRNIPYIIRPCGMLDPWSLQRRSFLKRALLSMRVLQNLNDATALHFTSDIERHLALRLGLNRPSIIEPNGVDLREFKTLPPRKSFSGQHPQLLGRPYVLFLGRMHHKKGLDLLVPAFAQAASQKNLSDWMLVISGPDSHGYAKTIHRLVRLHGLQDRVLFTGMLSDRQRIEALTDAEIFALPSRQENFGVALVEAMAAGVPTIISNQVNIHSDITDSGSGEVLPLSEAAFGKSLKQWMSDESRRREAGQCGRNFALSHYNWAHIAEAWEEHYSQLLVR